MYAPPSNHCSKIHLDSTPAHKMADGISRLSWALSQAFFDQLGGWPLKPAHLRGLIPLGKADIYSVYSET